MGGQKGRGRGIWEGGIGIRIPRAAVGGGGAGFGESRRGNRSASPSRNGRP